MKTVIKKIIKFFIPAKYIQFIIFNKIGYKIKFELLQSYIYDLNRYFEFSDTRQGNDPVKLLGRIIKAYHVIEKGLTMPETRIGFGKEMMVQLCLDCGSFIDLYGSEEEQIIHALQVIEEYKKFHIENRYEFDHHVSKHFEQLNAKIFDIQPTAQIRITKEEYFQYAGSDFKKFSNSRFSVRNFCNEDVPIVDILNALDIAKDAPSACNRQAWRTYIYTNKTDIDKILTLQGGNRGFGHLTNKLVIIAGEVGLFSGSAERNQAFIDGGIYAMNLLYSLHSQKIAGCILNCSVTPAKDRSLRELTKIKDSEVFISMVACGIPPEKFSLTLSKRYNIENTNTILN
jgi:nitroreductase